jgi:hypothetical protein
VTGGKESRASNNTAARLVFIGVAAAGLALFLWGALAAPVVVNSDTALDLQWARSGPLRASVPGIPHPPKPGYLLFLAAATRAFPGLGETRSVVVVQSVLLWVAIVFAAVRLSRRCGLRAGLALLVLLLFFARLRDSSNAVLSDCLAAALALGLVALCLEPPHSGSALAGLGAGLAILFWVRPNVGAIIVLVGAVLLAGAPGRRHWKLVALAFAAVMLPAWVLTRPAPGGDPLRGLGAPILMGSAPYYWLPGPGNWSDGNSRDQLRQAAANWRALASQPEPDRRRELLWRALHGVFGVELYDARWSPAYRAWDGFSRRAAPFLLAAAVSVLLAGSIFAPGLTPAERLAAPLLLAMLVAHDLVFGSHPRYILAFLGVLLLLATAHAVALGSSRRGGLAALAIGLGLFLLLRRNRGIVDWEWGLVEASGVRIDQTISARSLPAAGPATIHIRIAPPLLPTHAGLELLGPGGEVLYASGANAGSREPFLTAALPQALLDANRRGPVTLTVSSSGSYDDTHFLLFPVVPPPWGSPARRNGSAELSPGTGVRAGSLDWWAHAGAP